MEHLEQLSFEANGCLLISEEKTFPQDCGWADKERG